MLVRLYCGERSLNVVRIPYFIPPNHLSKRRYDSPLPAILGCLKSPTPCPAVMPPRRPFEAWTGVALPGWLLRSRCPKDIGRNIERSVAVQYYRVVTSSLRQVTASIFERKPLMNEKPLTNANQENENTLSRREMVGRIGVAGAGPAVVA